MAAKNAPAALSQKLAMAQNCGAIEIWGDGGHTNPNLSVFR